VVKLPPAGATFNLGAKEIIKAIWQKKQKSISVEEKNG